MKIQLPDNVKEIIDRLEENGYEAYAVGGCIRDVILNRNPMDWDITTSAKPRDVKALFKRTIDTGIEHGTVTIMYDKTGYEVTTFRIDGEYEDGRHPLQVEFVEALSEDLRRRDFTINALAYNDRNGLVDLFDGIKDMQDKIIRCVGYAGERFDEDALRMLRAVRFSAQLNFDIDEKTKLAIIENKYKIEKVSAERIRTELNKLLISNHPEKLIIAYETGITRIILPEFDDMMDTEQDKTAIHTIYVLKYLVNLSKGYKNLSEKQRLMIMWSALLHDISKPETMPNNTKVSQYIADDTKVSQSMTYDNSGTIHFYEHNEKGAIKAEKILKRLKFDNETINIVIKLIQYHNYRYDKMRYGLSPAGIRYAASIMGKDIIELLFILQEADIMSGLDESAEKRIKQLRTAEKMYQDIIADNECISLKNLAVNGSDLINSGRSQGSELGEVLKKLLEHVIENPKDNNKETLIKIAEGLFT